MFTRRGGDKHLKKTLHGRLRASVITRKGNK